MPNKLTFGYLFDFRNPDPCCRPPSERYAAPPGLPQERFRHYAGIFATDVLPAFK